MHDNSEPIKAKDGRARRKCSTPCGMSEMWQDYKIRRPLWMWADFLVPKVADRAIRQDKTNYQLENMLGILLITKNWVNWIKQK